jgi:hypothetical protein
MNGGPGTCRQGCRVRTRRVGRGVTNLSVPVLEAKMDQFGPQWIERRFKIQEDNLSLKHMKNIDPLPGQGLGAVPVFEFAAD